MVWQILIARIRSSLSFKEYFLNSNNSDKLNRKHVPEERKKKGSKRK